MKSKMIRMVVIAALCCGFHITDAAACKVLVVISFSDAFFWGRDQKNGIEKGFEDRCELRYAYLDMETAPDQMQAKGDQAYALYQEWQPDVVIAADEAAQDHLVIPYLKDKVATPVIFVSLFAPEQYGYPVSNVTGVKQIARWEEAFTFAQQLVPSIKTVVAVVNDTPSTRAGAPIFEKLLTERKIDVLPTFFSNNPEEFLAKAAELETQADLLFTAPSIGEELTRKLVNASSKPTFSAWEQSVEWGVLCGVVESGEELGQRAAEMAIKILDGTPVAELPIIQNEFGHRMINVTTLKALGIEPSRRLLAGVELIK